MAVGLMAALLSGCTGREPLSVDAAGEDSVDTPAGDQPAAPGTTVRPAPGGSGSQSTPTAPPAPNATGNATENATTAAWSLATHGWAPIEAALLRPGTYMENAQGTGCTLNFLFTNPEGTKAYAGTAAHCFASGEPSGSGDTNSCDDAVNPVEGDAAIVKATLYDPSAELLSPPPTPVAVGRFVYSSFVTMTALGETDRHTCDYNDFALVELDAGVLNVTNPALWTWGLPTGLRDGKAAPGEHLTTFGGNVMRNYPQGATRAREGWATPADELVVPDPWSFRAVFPGSCIPGDSGSPVLDDDGKAFAVVTRDIGAVLVAGTPACSLAYLAPALDYMMTHGGPAVVLAI